MTFRTATTLSVSLMAMALVLPVAALADPLVITNPAATTTNNGQVAPGTPVDSVNVTGNVNATTGPAISVGTVGGDFENAGNLTSSDDYAVFVDGDVEGSFINRGTIDSTVLGGLSDGVRIEGDVIGGFDNSGDVFSSDNGIAIIGDVSGGFSNSGSVIAGSSAVYIKGNLSGGFTNTGTGVIDGGVAYGVFVGGDFGGEFNNAGEIIGGGSYSGVRISGDMTGNFINSGSIEGDRSGVYINGNMTGNFTNTVSGVIDGGTGAGVSIREGLTGNFTNSGSLSGTSGVYIEGNINGSFAIIGNFANTSTGVIDGNVGVNIEGDIEGDFSNAGKIIGGSFSGVYVNGDITGNFANSGSIEGESYGVYIEDNFTGNFTNTNTGIIGGGSDDGVNIDGDFVGDFTNAGSIEGDDTGFYISGNFEGNFINTTTGVIEGLDSYGVGIDGDVEGNFSNAGRIIGGGGHTGVYIGGNVTGDFVNSGSIDAESTGVSISGDLTGDFVNSGSILGYSGVYIGGDFNGDFTNTAAGLIDGAVGGEGYGFELNGDMTGRFENAGEIKGGIDYFGVFIRGNLEQGFENSGTITGGSTAVVVSKNVTGGFTNHGRLDGDTGHGVFIAGNLDGFLNTGEIESNGSSDTALYVQSDLTGDFVNTGNMTNLVGQEYAAYIAGNFEGNFTSTWGQGLYGGSDIDIRGKTVTAFVNQYVADGSIWTALESSDTIYGDGPADYQGQNVTDTSVLIDVSVDQNLSDSNELVLAASRNRIASVADSGFGLAGTLDTVIDGIEDGGSPDGLTMEIINLLYAQSSSSGELNGTLASLSPDVRGAVATATQNLQMTLNAVNMRLIGGGGGAQQVASLMPNGQSILPTADAPLEETGLEMWVQGFFGKSSVEEDGGVAGADAGTFGVVAGIDGDTGRGFTLGGAFAYAHSDGEDDSDFTIDSFMPALYGKWQPDAWYLSAIISGGYHDVDQSRSGPMGASIDGDYSVSQVTLRGEAGWEIGVGSGVSVTPFVAAAYNYLSTSDFDESGSPYALSVDGSDDSFGTYEAGAKADLDLGGASLKAMAGYRWSGLDDVVDAAFSNGLSFGTDMTAELGGAFVDVDLMYAVTPAIQIGVGYDGVFGEDVTANYGSVKVEWTF